MLHYWNRRPGLWSPPNYLLIINGGTSMTIKGRMGFAPQPRLNLCRIRSMPDCMAILSRGTIGVRKPAAVILCSGRILLNESE